MDLLSHLARASLTLLSLKSIDFRIDDDIDGGDIDFKTVGFRERTKAATLRKPYLSSSTYPTAQQMYFRSVCTPKVLPNSQASF
jgi:hypothetical protein